MKRITIGFTLLSMFFADLSAASAADAVEWKAVKSASGTVKNTVQTSRGYRGKSTSREKPVYVPFSVSTNGFRVKWKTQSAGDRANLDFTLERQVDLPNGSKDWRRVEIVGRARGDDSGEGGFAAGPGDYRIQITGQHSKYDITVEEAQREKK